MEKEKQLELLTNMIQYSETVSYKMDLHKVEDVIFNDIPKTLEKNAPANFPELYFDFKHEFANFKNFIFYDNLIGKNIVALGGGFSSGKSSFLNSVMEDSILPEDINPSTSVPTYIVNGDEKKAFGINCFNSKMELEIECIKYLSHGFGENQQGKEITLGHLLKNLFVSVPSQRYSNLVMLDTPGYSKADSVSYSAKTDEKIARTQLNSANYILWFITADNGTITDSDITFLKSLNQTIPVLIIVNKADKIMPDELDDVIEKVKKVLILKGVRYMDVLSYSCNEPDDYDKDRILEYLSKWNNEKIQSTFARNFKVIFTKCKEYYDELLDEQQKLHSRLSHIIADTALENDDARDYLDYMNNQTKRNISDIKSLREHMKKLQTKFFTEIKKIADEASIDMPEPSDIDMIQDKITDPKITLDEYCKKHNLNTPENINTQHMFSIIISETLENCKPVFNEIYGGIKYSNDIKNSLTDVVGNNELNIKFYETNFNKISMKMRELVRSW